jgi:hypothetical protein
VPQERQAIRVPPAPPEQRARLERPAAQELRVRQEPPARRAIRVPLAPPEQRARLARPAAQEVQRGRREPPAGLVPRVHWVPPELLALAGRRVPPVTQGRSVLLERPAPAPGSSAKEAHRVVVDSVGATLAVARGTLLRLRASDPPSMGQPCRIKAPGEIVPIGS